MTPPLNSDYCSVCNDSKAVIFDIEANETVCGSCGIVLDNASVGDISKMTSGEVECQFFGIS